VAAFIKIGKTLNLPDVLLIGFEPFAVIEFTFPTPFDLLTVSLHQIQSP
jgi:hypothetical protein